MTMVGMTVSKLMAWMTDMSKLRAWTSVENQYIVIRPPPAAQRGSVPLFYAIGPWLKADKREEPSSQLVFMSLEGVRNVF